MIGHSGIPIGIPYMDVPVFVQDKYQLATANTLHDYTNYEKLYIYIYIYIYCESDRV